MRQAVLFVVLVLVFAIVALIASRPDDSRDDASQSAANDVARDESATTEESRGDGLPTSNDMKRGDERNGLRHDVSENTAAVTSSIRMRVNAPANVQAGEVFQVSIDVDANAGMREITLAVSYDKSRLAMVGWSAGDFTQRGGLPSDLEAQEPSDGDVQVSFDVNSGLSIAGSGSLIVLQFDAVKPGTSTITLRNATAIAASGAVTNVSAPQATSVTIQ
jgi:hypothetical protein